MRWRGMRYTMSLLREDHSSESVACACQQNEATGVFSLKIEPKTVDVRERPSEDNMKQVVRSEQLQDLFFPNMR